jgi:hypothetical protein
MLKIFSVFIFESPKLGALKLQSAGAILVVVVVSTRFFEFLRDSSLQLEETSK